MRITLDGPEIVDVAGASYFEELYQGVQFDVIDAGFADGHDLRVIAVQSDPDALATAVRWGDGLTERGSFVNGMAILVVVGSSLWGEPRVDYELDITDGSGTRTFGPGDVDRYLDPEWRGACEEPPPALPDAGEQPAEPVTAEAAIRARFDLLWDTDVSRDDKSDMLEDWTGVADAIDTVDDSEFAETAQTAIHVIDELVFTSPTDAWFRYSIQTDVSFFGDRYRTATLVDGVWQFPRALFCQDLGLTGGGCEPRVDAIYPPSWYEREGDHEIVCEGDPDGPEECTGTGHID